MKSKSNEYKETYQFSLDQAILGVPVQTKRGDKYIFGARCGDCIAGWIMVHNRPCTVEHDTQGRSAGGIEELDLVMTHNIHGSQYFPVGIADDKRIRVLSNISYNSYTECYEAWKDDPGFMDIIGARYPTQKIQRLNTP